MIQTLLGVGIGYLIFRWIENKPINTPTSDENESEVGSEGEGTRMGVWTLESVSNVKYDESSQLFYGCGTYAWDEGRTGTYRYIVVQASERGELSNWSELMGSDGSIAYTFAKKSDCERMVDEITKAPEPDSPVAPEPEPEPEPYEPPSAPLPEFGSGYSSGGWF